MPEELPDDPAAWPTDPFALLGVERGASELDIKRAYARLIKRFKPEHAPEQFRRVREAYEACLQGFRWLAPPPEAAWGEAPKSRPPAPDAPGPAAAYAGLVGLVDSRPDVRLRLYRLLGLNPALDPTRTRHDWLAAAPEASGLAGAPAELYRRELDADPDAALYGPYADVLDAHAAPWDRVAVAR